MLIRDKFEKDFGRIFDIYKYGSTVWSPLLGGILTGKYNDGVPADSRLSQFSDNPIIQRKFEEFFGENNKEK